MKKISFSPPDITNKEIKEVVKTLKSGWITTGPKTKLFEKELAKYSNTDKCIALNSCTAGLELILRLFDIGKGDEIITTPYTFAATCNVILHVDAKPVLVDIKKDEYNIDPEKIKSAITPRTKAIIAVDYGGYPCDYDEINQIIQQRLSKFKPQKGTFQEKLGKILLISDAAHSIGAKYKGRMLGADADFTVFSFHAVKNLTTAEGGAVIFNRFNKIGADDIYKKLFLLSLHGQSKDALSKMKAGNWQYSIDIPGFKCNMTDIQASLGLAQLKRYDKILKIRKKIYYLYRKLLHEKVFILPPFESRSKENAFHLFPLRISGISEKTRNKIIVGLAEKGIPANVHFIPIPLHKYYKEYGFNYKDYPNSYEMYKNEITLPLFSKLKAKTVKYICKILIDTVKKHI